MGLFSGSPGINRTKNNLKAPLFLLNLSPLCTHYEIQRAIFRSMRSYLFLLKARCRDADWINKTIKKKRIRQGPVISLYSEIHEDDRLVNYSKALASFLISTSQLANYNLDGVP